MNTSRGPKSPEARATGARRRARERTLGLCYEAEQKQVPLSAVVGELPVRPDAYVRTLVAGIEERAEEIDALITRHARDWALDRLPTIDRQVLRLSTYELIGVPDLPLAVVIDEAVELAKLYSTEDSARFVNGVLSAIAAEVRTGEQVPQ